LESKATVPTTRRVADGEVESRATGPTDVAVRVANTDEAVLRDWPRCVALLVPCQCRHWPANRTHRVM
jgi:hypothetical protein